MMNATIYTSDPSLPFADAMAVRNGRILRVGNYSSVQEFVGRETQKLNVHKKVMVPGLIDSHVHLISGGLQMRRVELRTVKSREEFVQRVKEAVRDKTPGEWILGGGWNNDFWRGDLPTASWMDEITPDNPVWLSRTDGHMGVANSLALKVAGITNNTDDPVGGTILKTTDGGPTGLLVDSAMKLVLDMIPEVSVNERRDALLTASKYALSKGVTTVIDVGRYFTGTSFHNPWQDLSDVYMWADSAGKMLIRVCLFFPIETWSRLAELREDKGSSLSQWIYLGGVKAFADGALGSNSALFHEPYEDDPQNYGLKVADFEWLLNATLASDRAGLQVAVHAIGDKANDIVLDMFKMVASSNGIRDRRFRIEHAQHLKPGSVVRFGLQEVIASVQPDHLLDDAESAERKIGAVRAQKGSYLFRSLLAGNARLAFGSDWPVTDINPLRGIQTAIARVPPGWRSAWIPSECVSLSDALNAYTISAAYAAFLDHQVGSLSPGKYADFVILDATTWAELAEQDVSSRVVEATYVSGAQAYP